jgi:hypothetical protein
MDKTKEFVIDKTDQVENLDEDDMETLFMVISYLTIKVAKNILIRKLN